MFSQRNRELHKAIYADNYAKVIQCLDVGPKRERKKLVDQVDNDGYTPLSTAARFGRIKIVTALLDRGAVIDKVPPGLGAAPAPQLPPPRAPPRVLLVSERVRALICDPV